MEQACEQLRMLQSAFARQGRKQHAKRIFQLREKMLRQDCGGPVPDRARLVARRAWHHATRSNTDLVRISGLAILIYIVVFPAVYKAGGLIRHHDADTAVTVWDSVVLSMATLVTLPVRDLVIESAWGSWIQTLEALSAYFVLGYVIWVVLRSFEE